MNQKKLRRSIGRRSFRFAGWWPQTRMGTRRPMLVPDRANIRWSLDFVSDALTDGRRFRVLAVVD